MFFRCRLDYIMIASELANYNNGSRERFVMRSRPRFEADEMSVVHNFFNDSFVSENFTTV